MAKGDFDFHFPFRIRYSEVDGQMVVFNAHYLTFFDTALTEFFRARSFDYQSYVKESGHDFHTVKTLVEYQAPIHFDDEIEVYAKVGRMGNTSISYYLEIHLKDEDSVLASGEVVWVHTNQETHKSAPLPEDLIAKLS